ncbi:nitroreductase family protein [Marinomonas posidonica]|uniref:nitroreductase family protein n=1 Tax=Marinomonas posidonica TaxID=936476 RepID=UPI001C0A8620|nr:nitroreductase family protein [Marinomonas posidonica]
MLFDSTEPMLWLAARAENIGLGWVSILHDQVRRDLLKIPDNIDIIAYLCIGYVETFQDMPDLEKADWLTRRNVESVIHHDVWQKKND